MKNRLLSFMLSICMLLVYTPVQTYAASSVPSGYTAVYTLEDIYKTADRDTPVKMMLMNDIDADNEDITEIIGGMWGTDHWVSKLTEGSVLDGGGHTIYNLKHKLVDQNFGTIRNINVSIYDTDDVEKHWEYGYWAIGHDRVAGICTSNEGTIEKCNVRITMHGKLNLSTTICGIAGSNSGTIKNCIAMFDVECNTSEAFSFYGITQGGVAATSSAPSLVDHCLTLGTAKCESSAYSAPDMAGIAKMYYYGDRESYNDSACALEQMYCKMSADSGQIWPGVMFAYAGQSSIEQAQVTNCRIANDMYLKVIDHDTVVAQDGKVTSAEKITLDSRANILKGWDTSKIPAARPAGSIKPTPEPDPTPTPSSPDQTTTTDTTKPSDTSDSFPKGDIWFSYSASDGSVKKHSFHYESDYFNKNGAFQKQLAVASLCLAMSAFSDNLNLAWSSTQGGATPARAANVLDIYKKLGFTNAQCVNYDVPLTDTSDKVAFSMAMKYINNGKGGTDTLIVVPIRGGGYGGEWGSNFNVTAAWKYSTYIKHLGFDSAATKAKTSVQQYIDQQNIKGDVKIWLTGYSRGSAVANLLGHYLAEEKTPGGISIQRKNLYAYTFATPAGVSEKYMDDSDTNMFNFISPVDLVPLVAPSQWGFGRYGQTIQLDPNFSDEAIERFRMRSGYYTEKDSDLHIGSSQQTELNFLLQWITDLVPDSGNYYSSGLQQVLVNKIGTSESRNPVESSSEQSSKKITKQWKNIMSNSITAIQALIDPKKALSKLVINGVKWNVEDFLNKKLDQVALAHCPELYLTWLELSSENELSEFAKASEKKQLVISGPDVNVKFYDKSSNRSVGSYVGGVCSSGDVEVEKTDIGLVATFPAGKDYSFSLEGNGSNDSVSFTIFAYDNDTVGDFAYSSQFTDLPINNNTNYTVTVPDDPYEESYAVDQNGKIFSSDDGIPRMNFTDVPASAYFYDAVQWAVESEITSGTSATRFSPGNACTRAQVVTFLWRAAGCPEPTSSYNPFADVPANAYYRDAVLWAAEEGITTGVSSNRFAPDATVTRGQTVAFLWRWDGEPDAEKRSGFRDVPAGAYYSDAVSWAVEMDITKGTSSTAFSPSKTCTRAQIVTFLYRDLIGVYE